MVSEWPAPMQDLFLGVDGLSTVQWHPYSTVGGARPGTLVAHIKSYGSWTSGLMRRLLRDGSVTMRIDGPYGEFEERPEWTRHRTLAIFAGGIGVRAAADMIHFSLRENFRMVKMQACHAACRCSAN